MVPASEHSQLLVEIIKSVVCVSFLVHWRKIYSLLYILVTWSLALYAVTE